MGQSIDLMVNYPSARRDVSGRGATRTEEDRRIAREFGREFFDGDRRHGYGGFHYHPRFWELVIPDFASRYDLTQQSAVLDVGCAKGFMLYDMDRLVPGIKVAGIDFSSYAIENAKSEVRDFLALADATNLPFEDDQFDLVISINTVHNLKLEECAVALREIERVSKCNSFIVVDAYRSDEERVRLEDWILTGRTLMHVDDWTRFFSDVGYTGDYYWFVP